MSSPERTHGDLLRFKSAVPKRQRRTETAVPPDKIRLLKTLVGELQQQLELLSEVQSPDIEQGLDFYDEVSRFEIALIRRALIINGGHQGRAARLLNLNATTLNAKIKHYRLERKRPRLQ